MSSQYRRLDRANLWWRFRAMLWTSPIWHFVYEQLLRFGNPRQHAKLVNRSTDVVIEAFSRSANTFLVHAYCASSASPVRIAHHLHDLIQVERGIKYGVPVVIIARNPMDAFVSYKLREPKLSVSTMQAMYEGFYHRVLELADHVTVLDYDDIIVRPNAVIAHIHDLLGGPGSDRRPVSVDQIFESIDQAERNLRSVKGKTGKGNGAKRAALSVARPTADKEARKQAVIEELQRDHADALATTLALYQKLIEQCVTFDRSSE